MLAHASDYVRERNWILAPSGAPSGRCAPEESGWARHSDDQTDHPDGRRYPCLGRFVAKSPDVIDVDRGETRIWPRRRHEEVADEDEGRGQSGPGGKCTPVVSELPGQIDEEEGKPTVEERQS